MLLLGVQPGSHPPLHSWQAQLIRCTLAISLFSLFFLWLKGRSGALCLLLLLLLRFLHHAESLGASCSPVTVAWEHFQSAALPSGSPPLSTAVYPLHVSFAEMVQKGKKNSF